MTNSTISNERNNMGAPKVFGVSYSVQGEVITFTHNDATIVIIGDSFDEFKKVASIRTESIRHIRLDNLLESSDVYSIFLGVMRKLKREAIHTIFDEVCEEVRTVGFITTIE